MTIQEQIDQAFTNIAGITDTQRTALRELISEAATQNYSPAQFVDALNTSPDLAGLRMHLSGQQFMMIEGIPFAIDAIGRAYIAGDTINAQNSQGFVNKAQIVVQVFVGSTAPSPSRGIRLAICYDSQDQANIAFAYALGQHLPGCDILLVPPTYTSYDWRDDLYLATWLCDAAILLITPGALISPQFEQALSMLTARMVIGADPHLRLFPVLFPTVSVQQLNASPLASFQVDQRQPIVSDDPQSVGPELAQRLQPLIANAMLARPPVKLEELSKSIGRLIQERNADLAILKYVALHTLEWKLEERSAQPDTFAQFALALWRKTPSYAADALEQLNNTFSEEQFQELKRYVRPG